MQRILRNIQTQSDIIKNHKNLFKAWGIIKTYGTGWYWLVLYGIRWYQRDLYQLSDRRGQHSVSAECLRLVLSWETALSYFVENTIG